MEGSRVFCIFFLAISSCVCTVSRSVGTKNHLLQVEHNSQTAELESGGRVCSGSSGFNLVFFVLLAHGESQESWISASVFFLFLGVFWIGCIELARCKYWELTGDHQRLGVTGSCLFLFWFSFAGVVSISWRITFRSYSSCCCKCEFLHGEEDWEKKTGRSRGVGSTKGTRSCCKSDVGEYE